MLRLKPGDEIVLFNGDGFDYTATLSAVTRKEVSADIHSKTQIHCESSLRLHLIQAVVKPDKMDWIMQKSVELGVTEITPVITKFCSVKITEKKIDHWKSIIVSACEQSGRSIIPALHPIMSVEKLFAQNSIKEGLIFHPKATRKLSEISMNKNQDTTGHIFIGPEGGFHDEEIQLAENHGFHSVQIGRRILRAETAALAALSLMQYIHGDF